MTEKNLTVIEEVMLPALTKDPVLVMKDGKYVIDIYDELMEDIHEWQKIVDSYDYQEQDRSAIKKLKADTNKFIKHIKSKVAESQKDLFDSANDQQKALNTELTKLSTALAKGLDEDDKKFKAHKRERIEELFEDAKSAYQNTNRDDFELDAIFETRWLNRTTNMTAITRDINQYVKVLDQLLSNDQLPELELEDIIDYLIDNDWDRADTVDMIQEDERKRQEMEIQRALEKRAREERERIAKEEREKQSNKKDVETVVEQKLPSKLVKFAGEDWQKAQAILDAAGISYTLI